MGKLRDRLALAGQPRLRRTLEASREAGLATVVGPLRLSMLAAAAELCLEVEGDYIEFGTFRGGSAAVIGTPLKGTGKTLHVCDSFEGLPAPSEEDVHFKQGWFAGTDAERVGGALEQLGIPVRVHKGFFCDTLPQLEPFRIALAHIDVDLFSSFQECLQFTYPRMTPGGIMLFDDYDVHYGKGVRAAVDGFFADKQEQVVPITGAQRGVWVGTDRTDLFEVLRRRAGWTAAAPLLGPYLFQRRLALK